MQAASQAPAPEEQPRKKPVVAVEEQNALEDAQVLAAMEDRQGCVSAATEAALQEAISKAEKPVNNYTIDARPVSEQRSDPAIPKRNKDMLYYYQKHGENLEREPPCYGCLHPKWQKQYKDKQLTREELARLWQIEKCYIESVDPKASHHMISLDKWTAWCRQHHQGDLSATPEKHQAFSIQLYEEALSKTSLTHPHRHYQNSTSSIYTKLVKRHGFAEPDYNPFKTQEHRQRGRILMQLHRSRVGM